MKPFPYSCDTKEVHDLQKAHQDDAAYDLRAKRDFEVFPGSRTLVETGIRVAIPEGHAGLVLPRSGLALREGITVLNAPGLIDPGYRGDIGIILYNSQVSYTIQYDNGQLQQIPAHPYNGRAGDRIAQLLIVKTAEVFPMFVAPEPFDRLYGDSARGEGGFGSTGR